MASVSAKRKQSKCGILRSTQKQPRDRQLKNSPKNSLCKAQARRPSHAAPPSRTSDPLA
jgi:hypothetical protein